LILLKLCSIDRTHDYSNQGILTLSNLYKIYELDICIQRDVIKISKLFEVKNKILDEHSLDKIGQFQDREEFEKQHTTLTDQSSDMGPIFKTNDVIDEPKN
jgi:hypothetical protein